MSRVDTITEADAYDDLLLAEGRHAELLARHDDSLRMHAVVTLRGRHGLRDGADDVLQMAYLRLIGELRAGRRYGVPFRVVAHQVVRWSADAFAKARRERAGVPVPPDLAAADGDMPAVVLRVSLEASIAGMPPSDRRAAELVWLEGATPAEAAERIGCTRNALDQALARARRRLREVFDGT